MLFNSNIMSNGLHKIMLKSYPFKKIINFIFYISFILIITLTIIFIVYVMNARKNGGDISFGGFHLYNIVSGSMQPSLPVGCTILSKKIDPTIIKKGDIISFRSGSIVISHRVFDIYTQENNIKVYSTKGDANNGVDENLVFSNQIVGKVTNYVPYLGYALNFMTTKNGMMTIIVFPLLIFVAFEFIGFFIELNRYLKYREEYNI
jgi:signal peptidase